MTAIHTVDLFKTGPHAGTHCVICGEHRNHSSHAGEVDPTGLDAHTPGAKLDGGKLRPWLMFRGFANALEAVADVTTRGAIKYSPDGWAQVENGVERYMEAFARHELALGQGNITDEQTGCYHKAQMIWNLLASLELELRQP